MTDEIIIDGVDVSGCKHYKNQNCLADYLLTNKEFSEAKCIASPNCYYKQLARKTEECEKLKSYYNLYRQNQDELKKIQGIINLNPKYGLELTETGVIDKDIRLSYLNTSEQIKLIFTEYEQQLQAEKQKVEDLKKEISLLKTCGTPSQLGFLSLENKKYKQALEEIKEIVQQGLQPICYKSNCSKCSCYRGENANAELTAFINNYFDHNAEFSDENGDFVETLEGLLDNERSKCNKAKPICEKVLQKCEVINE